MKTNKREVYLNRAKKIIAKYQAIARIKGIKENFGESDYRKYRSQINACEDLMYSEKADLCLYLSEQLAHITL